MYIIFNDFEGAFVDVVKIKCSGLSGFNQLGGLMVGVGGVSTQESR